MFSFIGCCCLIQWYDQCVVDGRVASSHPCSLRGVGPTGRHLGGNRSVESCSILCSFQHGDPVVPSFLPVAATAL